MSAHLAKRLKRLFPSPQPRIPGTTRTPSYTALLPVVAAKIEAQARREGRSKASVEAERLCRSYGYDYASGERLPAATTIRRVRTRAGTVVAFRVKGGRA
jgi:hypothetical protein